MSIKNAADLVRAHGRFGDSQLMHVTPKEVQALQTIAQAHGKSLSVNPNTGLPEAFDLGAILPTVAGTVVGSMVGMPWLGAAIGGLGTYATTGSLEKGLMAGLGAFGGASFGAALGGVGAASAAAPAATGVAETAAATSIAPELASVAAPAAEAFPVAMDGAAGLASPGTSGFSALSDAQAANLMGGYNGAAPAISQSAFNALPAAEKMSAIQSGIQQLYTNPSETWSAMGGLSGQGKNLGMMVAPLLSGAMSSSGTSSTDTEPKGDIRQYDYDPIGRRFAARPVVAAKNFTGFQPSVFGYAEGGKTEAGVEDSNRAQIARFYRTYLNREPDQAGLDYWTNEVNSGASLQSVLNNIKISEEAKRLQSNRGIEDTYRDYLGRSPSQLEMADLQQAIKSGTPMDQVQQNIRQSQEAAGIAAAAQQRQQMFSPIPPAGPMVAQTPVQQTGINMIPNRYQAPVNIPSQGVQDYNQMLANRAAYEYTKMPMLQAIRPRTPVELEAIRDKQLVGQQMMAQNALRGAKPAQAAEAAPTAAPIDQGARDWEMVQKFGYNPFSVSGGGADGGGGGGGSAGGADGASFAKGGAIGIMSAPKFQAGGEMESDAFVIPADVVSALGNGSTDAGVRKLNDYLGVALLIEGEGDGLSDDIPATIDGEQPARVADGEVYIPANIVAQLGEGDPEEGAEMLYELIDKVRQAAHGKKTQQREVDLDEVMPE